MSMLQPLLRNLPKIALGLCCAACWLVLVVAVLSTSTGWQVIALLGLVIALLSLTLSVGCFVFVLSKQLSTHGVQVVDINRAVSSASGKVEEERLNYSSSPPFDDLEVDDEENVRAKWARGVIGELFNPTKENLNDGVI